MSTARCCRRQPRLDPWFPKEDGQPPYPALMSPPSLVIAAPHPEPVFGKIKAQMAA